MMSEGTWWSSLDEREHLKSVICVEGAIQGSAKGGRMIASARRNQPNMVARVRRQFGTRGPLTRKKRKTPPIQPIFDGQAQARLIALACSTPPPGHARWSIRLLADKVVELKIVERAHFNTVGRALKKTISSRI